MKAEGQLSVLLVEDNAGDARLIGELLRDIPEVQLSRVESLAAALGRLAQPGWISCCSTSVCQTVKDWRP